ncbi:MAG: SDR family oxidoreductase [Chloroflexi bacterium]|nr:SDR family oxidoreductase [Chloroflexota bacterium]
MELRGKVAIITGGGTGIGAATALALAGEGAKIVVAGRRRDALEGTVARIGQAGGEALAVPTDVTRDQDVERLVQETLKAFGGVHVLVNNAARASSHYRSQRPTDEWQDVAAFDDIIATNLRGAFLCIRAVLPTMMEQRSGIILNLLSTSIYSSRAFPGTGAYVASKLGLMGLTRVLANAVHEYGIRVHALCPSNIDTPMARRGVGHTEADFATMLKPEDVAEAVRWLLTQPPRVSIEEVAMTSYFEKMWRV